MTLPPESEIAAKRISTELSLNAVTSSKAWDFAPAIRFSQDWRGKEPDPSFTTEVRALWTPRTLYLRFACSYRDITVFDDSQPDGRRDRLWERDVAEAFLQPEPSSESYYKEFEVAPNGMWIDLDITPSGLADLKSGLKRSVHIDEPRRLWVAELAIPIRSITAKPVSGTIWRANFYRVEGSMERRRYMAWQPTHTPQPNFHIPEAFGSMRFVE
jgi:alpha-galactosidase